VKSLGTIGGKESWSYHINSDCSTDLVGEGEPFTIQAMLQTTLSY